MMDSRLPEHPHAQFGGMVGFPYPLGHPHVYELAGHQLQSAAAAAAAASVPFSIDGLLNGSCAASVVNPAPLIPSGCGVGGDGQPFKLSGKRAGRWEYVGQNFHEAELPLSHHHPPLPSRLPLLPAPSSLSVLL
uniref:Uncharacterized protein n=1 Tax=Varanus komodoensis TaxID=61221 RepID=A0A8D2IIZ7_VARKO